MRKLFVLMALFMPFLLGSSFAAGAKKQAKIDMNSWRYELEPMGEGQQGAYKVKVWTYSKKQKVAEELCKKCGVHGVVFKGTLGMNRVSAKKPLVTDPGAVNQYEDFFQSFFADGGDYMKYVQLTSPTPQIIKSGKEYKVGLICIIYKDELRKALEKAGIIKALDAGF